MRLKKLSQSGFSHHFIMLAVVVVVAIAGIGYLVAGNAATPCTKRVFAEGSHGGCVKAIQYLTTHHIGGIKAMHPDGVFGSKTKEAVKRFQRIAKIKSD